VLDLSRLLPGPYATLVLAELGAQVDKVEEPDGGDGIRAMPPLHGNDSAFHHALNRNKRSIALDLKNPVHKAAFLKLVPRYDVLVESFRPGVMERLGLGYATLQALHPGLIYCAITGFGQQGPDALKAGHDLGYLARAGLLGGSGPKNQGPPLPGGQVADIAGGSLFGLVAILTALWEREKTGHGRMLDIAMAEGALALSHLELGAQMVMQAAGARRGEGPLNGGYASYNIYETSDGKHLAVGALEPKFFAKLCAALGVPESVAAGYDTSGGGAGKVRAQLASVFATRTRDAWMEMLGPLDVCVEPIQSPEEALRDPHFTQRGLFEGGALRVPMPFPHAALRSAPALGEHTREILEDAGLSSDVLQPVTGFNR
jgi:alpha-methylacyl-CoA racemase